MKLSSLVKYISEPWRMVVAFDRHVLSIVPDKLFLKCYYRSITGEKLNLKNPQTFTDKINWLKLYGCKEHYKNFTDKYAVKECIRQFVNDTELNIIPVISAWDSAEEIDFSVLPQKFVLKCNHDSGSVVICTDKDKLDIEKIKKYFSKRLKCDYWKLQREKVYKGIKPKIIAEEYISQLGEGRLIDYKFFCFDGKPEMILALSRENGFVKYDYFDVNWNHLNLAHRTYPMADHSPQKPNRLEKMLEYAKTISSEIPHVRVDFYNIEEKIYFGEMTFYNDGGTVPFEPEWNIKLGNLIKLPQIKE